MIDRSRLWILDLPVEIPIIILEKLEPIDVLYSLVGVNKRLNNIAGDVLSYSAMNCNLGFFY
jgi:hypothetical protein